MLLTFFSIQRNAPLSSPLLLPLLFRELSLALPLSLLLHSPSLSLALSLPSSLSLPQSLSYCAKRNHISLKRGNQGLISSSSSTSTNTVLFRSSQPPRPSTHLSSYPSPPHFNLVHHLFCLFHPYPLSKVGFPHFASTLSSPSLSPPSHFCFRSCRTLQSFFGTCNECGCFDHPTALFHLKKQLFVDGKVCCLSFLFRAYIGIQFLCFSAFILTFFCKKIIFFIHFGDAGKRRTDTQVRSLKTKAIAWLCKTLYYCTQLVKT